MNADETLTRTRPPFLMIREGEPKTRWGVAAAWLARYNPLLVSWTSGWIGAFAAASGDPVAAVVCPMLLTLAIWLRGHTR